MNVELRPITASDLRKRVADLEALDPAPESDDWIVLEMYRSALRMLEARNVP